MNKRPRFTLNPQQEIIKNQAVEWFRNGSEQVFEIDGAAGTGKTVLISEILRALDLEINEYMPMAFTGQASIVMRTRGFTTAKSIHSSLYEVVEVTDKDSSLAAHFGISAKKKVFRLRKFIDPAVRLFFIDEAFMVPDTMVRDILSFGIKVIVAGDAHQLPPVTGNPGFLTGYGVHHLTQLMRQAETSPIVYIAKRAMEGLPIHAGNYGNQVLVITDNEFIPEMVGFADCICCGTNRTRETINQYVRQLAGFTGNLPHFGERVICRNNNWQLQYDGIALANGLTGTVLNNPDPSRFNGKIFTIDFKPDLADILFENLPVDYQYFISPFAEKNELKNPLAKRFLEGELFDFAYALTTHLCQGSEYANGIYIEEFMRPQIQNQLNYTGITRFKQKLVYIKKTNKYFQIPEIQR